ncbi:MAG: flavodoxin family protein [Chitinophagia bacterium]
MKLYPILVLLFIGQFSFGQAKTKNILITYYSKTAHTQSLAEEVAKGAASIQGVQVILKSINQTTTKDLLDADAIIIGSPVYNANLAPEVVQFISAWPFEGNPLKDKIGAAFVTAGGISAGEELAQVNILHSMLIFGMIVVGGDEWTSAFGASAITNESVFKTEKLNALFLQKGFSLGKRVAMIAQKMR